jgi:hypothetical protein
VTTYRILKANPSCKSPLQTSPLLAPTCPLLHPTRLLGSQRVRSLYATDLQSRTRFGSSSPRRRPARQMERGPEPVQARGCRHTLVTAESEVVDDQADHRVGGRSREYKRTSTGIVFARSNQCLSRMRSRSTRCLPPRLHLYGYLPVIAGSKETRTTTLGIAIPTVP